jgi:ribosomal protein L2
MAIRKFKATTNGRRGMSTLVNEELTQGNKPQKSLLSS